jgi:hypothetical protein
MDDQSASLLSFPQMRSVAAELLQNRLEQVKHLAGDELDLYEIVKDKPTGDHYIHYVYVHRDFAAGGQEESFHQLLPVDSDEVLGILFSDEPYSYPHHWKKPFLRNGPDGSYVWFDPGYVEGEKSGEEIGAELREMLLKFKSAGKLDEQAVSELLKESDKLRDRED